MIWHYYNEIDKDVCRWLNNLIRKKLIPPGEVDCRDIREVKAEDFRGATSCHWFAGISGWPLALHLAGWPASRPVWTASCPCQPWSVAGRKRGAKDHRDLWPDFYRLVREARPAVIIGEQVASAAVLGLTGKDKSLPFMQDREILRRVLHELQGEPTEHMQRLCLHRRKNQKTENPQEECGEFQKISEQKKRIYLSQRSQISGRQEESGFQLRPERHSKEDRKRILRSVGHSIRSVRSKGVERPVTGQDRLEEGVHCGQRESRFVFTECDVEYLGTGAGDGSDKLGFPAMPDEEQSAIRSDRPKTSEEFERTWLSRIQTDLEEEDYRIGICVLAAGGVGAPHLRRRLYWVADADGGQSGDRRLQRGRQHRQQSEDGGTGVALGDTIGKRLEVRQGQQKDDGQERPPAERAGRDADFWDDYEILPCLDGKSRRIERGAQCLVNGVSARLADGRATKKVSRQVMLRAIGNAITPPLAAEFIRAYMETLTWPVNE